MPAEAVEERPVEQQVFLHRHCQDQSLALAVRRNVTDPGLQGDRSSAGTKPATLETGAVVQVPLFISTGETVRIDTRTGAYVTRVR